MDRIELELTPGEAILALAAIHTSEADAYAVWRTLIATNAPDEEQAIPLAKGQIMSRLAARLSAQLYPECEWYEPCETLATGRFNDRRYCSRHVAQLEGRMAVA